MPCSASCVSPANTSGLDELQCAAIEQVQLEKLTQIVDTLDKIEVPTIRKNELSDLSITLGAQLNVDESSSSPSDCSDTFFGPCDWPPEVLEYETHYGRRYWRDIDPRAVDQAILLLIPESITLWLRNCLQTLDDLVPDLWDFYCSPGSIRETIGLRVPFRLFHPRPWRAKPYYQYYAQWVMFAPATSGMPHASCLVLDSGTPDDETILLSEAEAAAALVKFQLQDGSYTNHHTKPVLVATILRNRTARLTQAHFDGKQNMLVMRQSRTLDLSGAAPGPDAWTLLRWMASQPIGETRYVTGDADEGACGDDPANLAPRISV